VQIIRRVNDVHIKNQTINHCFVIKLNKNDQFFSVAQDLKKPKTQDQDQTFTPRLKTKTKHWHQDSRPRPRAQKNQEFSWFQDQNQDFFFKILLFWQKNFFFRLENCANFYFH
jgi:hypothetical protein